MSYSHDLKEKARKLRNESTIAEVLLWNQIKRKVLGCEFHRQVPLAHYIVDFYCHELMLAIEIDGSSHDDKFTYDCLRQQELEKKGVRFIRFKDEDVKRNMEGVIQALKKYIDKTSPGPASGPFPLQRGSNSIAHDDMSKSKRSRGEILCIVLAVCMFLNLTPNLSAQQHEQNGILVIDPRPISSTTVAPIVNPMLRRKIAMLIEKAAAMVEEGNMLKAQAMYENLFSLDLDNDERGTVEKAAGDVNVALLFSKEKTADSDEYEIVYGDTLGKIADKNNTTIDLLQKANKVTGEKIYAGRKLKVVNKPFRIEVDKSENEMYVFCGKKFFKRYDVATGSGNKTPVGNYEITTRLIDPVWYSPNGPIKPTDPKNILGTRWLGFDLDGYGIHGTTDPDSIGTQATAGCVRMHNKEVEELFAYIPRGTKVVVKQ